MVLRSANSLHQLFQQAHLRRIDLLLGLVQAEKPRLVHFRKFLRPTGARGPLEDEGVASDLGRVAIPFERPGMDHLAGFLLDGGQRDKTALGFEAELLLEFAFRRRQRLFVGAGVLPSEWSRRRRPCSSRTARPDARAGIGVRPPAPDTSAALRFPVAWEEDSWSLAEGQQERPDR